MKKREIVITIDESGTISAETHGIKGEACLDYIEVLEEMLNAKTLDSNLTDEYYESAHGQVSTTQEIKNNE